MTATPLPPEAPPPLSAILLPATPVPATPMPLPAIPRPANRVAVVTGASSDLGRALAIGLARQGVHVAGIARDARRLAQTADLCPSGLFTALPGDVTDPQAMRDLAAQVAARIGPVGIVINSAIIYRRDDFLTHPAETFVRHIHVNCCGPIHVASAFLPAMLEQGRGRIVNIGSFAGADPVPGSLGYSVSKAGARSFTQALTVELAGRLPGISVVEWFPGVRLSADGQAEDIPADIVAPWGVALALDDRPGLHGASFMKDREMLEPRSLRRRIKNALLFKPTPMPRILTPHPSDPGTGDVS